MGRAIWTITFRDRVRNQEARQPELVLWRHEKQREVEVGYKCDG